MHIELLQIEASRVAQQGHDAQGGCVTPRGSRKAGMQAVKACQ